MFDQSVQGPKERRCFEAERLRLGAGRVAKKSEKKKAGAAQSRRQRRLGVSAQEKNVIMSALALQNELDAELAEALDAPKSAQKSAQRAAQRARDEAKRARDEETEAHRKLCRVLSSSSSKGSCACGREFNGIAALRKHLRDCSTCPAAVAKRRAAARVERALGV